MLEIGREADPGCACPVEGHGRFLAAGGEAEQRVARGIEPARPDNWSRLFAVLDGRIVVICRYDAIGHGQARVGGGTDAPMPVIALLDARRTLDLHIARPLPKVALAAPTVIPSEVSGARGVGAEADLNP